MSMKNRTLNKTMTSLFANPKQHPQGLEGCLRDIHHTMTTQDYNLTMNEMSVLLDCSVRFIQANMLSKINNIILNSSIKGALKSAGYQIPQIDSSLYYFSRSSFYHYLTKTTKGIIQGIPLFSMTMKMPSLTAH